ncbi:MAG TPA: hypothetical protein VGJ54_00230 [Streptosporangiaceae bacterium]
MPQPGERDASDPLAASNRPGGYDRGLLLPGLTMAYNGTGQAELVTPGGRARRDGMSG